MTNERNGASYDTGSRHKQKPRESKEEIIQSNGGTNSSPEVIICSDAETFAEEIASKEVEKVTDLIAIHRESLLPPAEEWNAYDDSAKTALLDIMNRQTKAIFDDESVRQNKLTEAEIKQGKSGQILAGVVIIAAMLVASFTTVMGGNAWVAGGIAALPTAAIIGNLFIPARSKSSHKNNQDK